MRTVTPSNHAVEAMRKGIVGVARYLFLVAAGCGRIGFAVHSDGRGDAVGTGSEDGDGTGSGSIAFVQESYAASQSAVSGLSLTLPQAQRSGDLNVVFVSWFDGTATVVSLADANGNQYVEAIPPPIANHRLSVYYATNVVEGSNELTVAFSAAVPYSELRVAAYAGIAQSTPLTGVAQNQGTSATSNSGPLTTTVPNEIVIAGNVIQSTKTLSPGSGFTQRQSTSFGGHIIEDQVFATATATTPSATLTGSSAWAMSAVAFRPQ